MQQVVESRMLRMSKMLPRILILILSLIVTLLSLVDTFLRCMLTWHMLAM